MYAGDLSAASQHQDEWVDEHFPPDLIILMDKKLETNILLLITLAHPAIEANNI